jgi:hypothetical protein
MPPQPPNGDDSGTDPSAALPAPHDSRTISSPVSERVRGGACRWPIRQSIVSSARLPISWAGWRSVVRGTRSIPAYRMSSNPTIRRSSGTRRESRSSCGISAAAVSSFPHTTSLIPESTTADLTKSSSSGLPKWTHSSRGVIPWSRSAARYPRNRIDTVYAEYGRARKSIRPTPDEENAR